jgi:SiaC family regulatory phosphoprotein
LNRIPQNSFYELMRIEATRHTPLLEWDITGDKVFIRVDGVSIPENAYLFFKPFEEFINGIDTENVKNAEVILRLEYMNSLSSKAFLDYVRQLHTSKLLNMNVIWEYYDDDEEMREYGDTFSEIVRIPFQFREISAEERDRKE